MSSTLDNLLLVWLAIMGGSIGSFLNVVVYRWPRGESLLRPGSHCPSCGHAIRPYHNVPILGWLILRGRCYDCGEKFSIRYALIEATVAVMFVALALTGPLAGEAAAPPHPADNIAASSTLIKWCRYALFAAAFCVLSVLTLIAWDAKQVPRPRAMLLAVGLVAVAALILSSRVVFGSDPAGQWNSAIAVILISAFWIVIFRVVWRSSAAKPPTES